MVGVWFEKRFINVVSFNVGKRTYETLSHAVESLKRSGSKIIFTDKLRIINILYICNSYKVNEAVNVLCSINKISYF